MEWIFKGKVPHKNSEKFQIIEKVFLFMTECVKNHYILISNISLGIQFSVNDCDGECSKNYRNPHIDEYQIEF